MSDDVNKVTGIVEFRDVKDVPGKGKFAGQTSQKIQLKVNGTNYSTFSNSVPNDVAERLEHIKAGDEVELTYKTTEGTWQGKPVTYRNIVDAIKVTRPDGEPPSARVEPERPRAAGRSTGDGRESPDVRVRSMALAYAKDKHIQAGDWDNESIIVTAKRFEQYIQTGE